MSDVKLEAFLRRARADGTVEALDQAVERLVHRRGLSLEDAQREMFGVAPGDLLAGRVVKGGSLHLVRPLARGATRLVGPPTMCGRHLSAYDFPPAWTPGRPFAVRSAGGGYRAGEPICSTCSMAAQTWTLARSQGGYARRSWLAAPTLRLAAGQAAAVGKRGWLCIRGEHRGDPCHWCRLAFAPLFVGVPF